MNVKELFNLTGKIALVTGGSGNYGTCIVEGLAEAGATVITTSRNLERAQQSAAAFKQKGLDVHAMVVSQNDEQSVQELRKQVNEQYGRLDIFVNNAVSRPMNGYHGSIAQFRESMEDNATGMLNIMREMAELIVQSGGGSVINI